MKLYLIQYATCPTCGAKPVMESCHSADHDDDNDDTIYHEMRKFACGAIINECNNLLMAKLYNNVACPNIQKIKTRNAIRTHAYNSIVAHLNTLSLDDEFKEVFQYHLDEISNLLIEDPYQWS